MLPSDFSICSAIMRPASHVFIFFCNHSSNLYTEMLKNSIPAVPLASLVQSVSFYLFFLSVPVPIERRRTGQWQLL